MCCSASRCTSCGCSSSPRASTATSAIAPTRWGGSCSSSWPLAVAWLRRRACCGGRVTIATTTSTAIRKWTFIRHERASGGATWGWILCTKYEETPMHRIKDFAKYPELRFLNKYHLLPATILGVACFVLGGSGALFGGFFLSTVLLYHGHLHDQLLHAYLGIPPIQHDGHKQELAAVRTDHARRRLAQQPPLLSVQRESGLLLVGDRHQLLRAQSLVLGRPGARPPQTICQGAPQQTW